MSVFFAQYFSDILSDSITGLDGLVIDKMALNKDQNKIRFYLSGFNSINDFRVLTDAVYELSVYFSDKVDVIFTDADEVWYNSLISGLGDYLFNYFYFGGSIECDLDSFDYNFIFVNTDILYSDGKFIFNCSKSIGEIIDRDTIQKFANTVSVVIATILSIKDWDNEINILPDVVAGKEYDYVFNRSNASNTSSAVEEEKDYEYYQNYVEYNEVTQNTDNTSQNFEKKEDTEADANTWLAKSEMIKKNLKKEQNFFKRKKFEADPDVVFGNFSEDCDTLSISELSSAGGKVNIVGKFILFDEEDKGTLNKKGTCVIEKFCIIDKTGGISAIAFPRPSEADKFDDVFRAQNKYAIFQGTVDFTGFEPQFKVDSAKITDSPKQREDKAPVKRVELHVHTSFSEKDALIAPKDLAKQAQRFGHRACAVTDHGVVQGFPHFDTATRKMTVKDSEEPFKAILGCEGYLADDGPTVFYNIPFDDSKKRKVGSIVALSLRLENDADVNTADPLTTKIKSVFARKYVLKNYKGIRTYPEGETPEAAAEFSKIDIDTSLWNPEELPESLRNPDAGFILDLADDKTRKININDTLDEYYSSDDTEYVPDEICFVHSEDFYVDVEDGVYSGKGEPPDSYFDMGRLVDFIGDAYLCGENIFAVLGFIRRAGYAINIEEHKYYRFKFNMPVIDIESILEFIYPDYYEKYHYDINNLLTDFEINNNVSDSEIDAVTALTDDDNRGYIADTMSRMAACAEFVIDYLKKQDSVNAVVLNERIGHKELGDIIAKKNKYKHIILLARDEVGKYNLYRLVSESHLHYFGMRPRMPRSMIKYFKSSIIIGGACEQGEVFRLMTDAYGECNKNKDACVDALCASLDFRKTLKLYDYLEIQPLTNNSFMTRRNSKGDFPLGYPVDMNDIRNFNIILTEIADRFGMPCCATTDAHFLNKDDAKYRKYLLMDMGFKDADEQADLYFRTTDEMLEEFSYLGEEKAYEVVVANTNMIADKINYGIKAFPDGTYPPIIPTAAQDVINIAWTKANRMYRYNGKLNQVVKDRLDVELESIIGNGYGIMYYIAYRLVKKSNRDGYIVGSRGSVGSSFVATMCGISEVNPLAPHYLCEKCHYLEFDNSGEYGSGFDMPKKLCPNCNIEMHRDGQDIPFETFLGFGGGKQPDIDLNFSGEYQPNAHKYVEYLFGISNTFRAGTVSGLQANNVKAIATRIGEQNGVQYSNATKLFMTEGIIGVKSTTGQHPGGIVVIPKEMEIYEFTPVQYPANKVDSGIITTHYTFKEMHDTILKLDILGHDDPTVLKMLNRITGVQIEDIPIPDDQVMRILESTDVLGFPIEKTDAGAATLGLPEVGTDMARGMIKETKPTTFYDIVQLMGLSHGTDVWTGNAQELIRKGICDIKSVIGCRDSIMTRLIYWGLPNKDSFQIMEGVRKGKGLKEEQEALMIEKGVPDWYIESCKKIKYMFPKAHAAAYTISLLRVAWFKVYKPEEYYCAFFSIRGDEFDADTMCRGQAKVVENRKELARAKQDDRNNPKLKSKYYLTELVEEMYARDIEFVPISIMESDAVYFKKVDDKKILPPLNAISSISDAIANSIVKAREDGPFANKEDIMTRAGVGQSTIKRLTEYGLLDDLPDSSQVSMFDLLGGM